MERREAQARPHPCHARRPAAPSRPDGWLDRARWWIVGLGALVWLLVRSGSKPSRMTYPCQQAAASTATLVLGGPAVAVALGLRHRLPRRLRSWPALLALGAVALIGVFGALAYREAATAYVGPVLDPRAEYRAELFHVTNDVGPVGDRFAAIEDMVETMGARGLKFHRSSAPTLTSGPDGIIGADDVVLVKINYQWDQRGGTNTDLLRGLIRRILDHPDGFDGEVVVVENAQFNSTSNFDRTSNNAEETTLSPHDVVVHFQSQGNRVSHFDWTPVRYTAVDEFSAGDSRDGYVVYPYDSTLNGRQSYPKFTTAYGSRVSMKHGIWEIGGYDRERLTVINVPVLKSHHATYGATAAVKHYMGVVTRELSTNSHGAIAYGMLGAVMADVRPPDLNVLDCTWINANPYSGPSTSYSGATRRDMIVAGRDPIAVDIWAVKNILVPAFVANGYSPPWPSPSADPDLSTSAFRLYLDRSMSYLLQGGYDVTNDLARIDVTDLAVPGEASEPGSAATPFTIAKATGDGFELDWSAPVRGGQVARYDLYRVGLGGATTPACEADLGTGTSAFLASLPDDSGFLVVARNATGGGSAGRDGEGRERPLPAVGDVCP